MGIPKFFRFMSERYPLISRLIQENNIPEFDALYLDMNGIIHNCSHPNDNDASFRITEEAIFLAVFRYVEHLFAVIKPQKLFFLAIDGVAPRAKMNQQRSRRFRTAKEMKETIDKAIKKGEEIPEGDGFDSNCITPGTPFMARLSAQLKYFISKKVSEDADWRGVEIVLSGHEVPGEGEHKIMEYIRLKKAQPGYDPNVRHCLYGLDADLIMLGLLSHDPHFCLLREEVTFGPRGGKGGGKIKGVETTNFFLLHLSLFREYLDLEFHSLKTAVPPLPFEYDLERIIDDFILLNIFVGNDFLPHLPGLHINEGALGRLFEIYKKILPIAGGYLNEHGTLNVQRLQLVLNELTVFEQEHFEHEFADSNWFKGKQTKHLDAVEKARQAARSKVVLTKDQRDIFNKVRNFLDANLQNLTPDARLTMLNTLPARDRRFLSDLADELHLVCSYDEFDTDGNNLVVLTFDETMLNLASMEETSSDEDEGEWKGAGAAGSAEWMGAILRVLKKYEKAETARDVDEDDSEDEQTRLLKEKMAQWKSDYYREKLEFEYSPESPELHDLAYRYIEGLQWVLHYYYSGVVSWSWFYNYHYAPKISDLCNAHTYKFEFSLGQPFHPFEQLMGVLPDLSSAHIPPAFRDLMSDPASPIIDFYPVNFEQDLNGKKQDWEAIVKIPFIDEKRLLETMAARSPRLTAEERARNEFGNAWRFTYDDANEFVYPSSLPGSFPDLVHCRCKLEVFNLPTLDGGLAYLKGLVPGALLGKDAVSGFPSLQTIPHTGLLSFHGVNVFQGDSRKETMVVTIDSDYDGLKPEDVARLFVGKRTYTGYPYLRESLVVAVSDELFRYTVDRSEDREMVIPTPHSGASLAAWKRAADRLEHVYSKKTGCIIGQVDIILHVKPLKGLSRQIDGSTVKEYEDNEQEFALQTTVGSVSSEDVRFIEQPAIPVELEFPIGTKVFFLGEVAYGVPAQVMGHENGNLSIKIAFFPNDKLEPQAFQTRLSAALQVQYTPSHAVARQLGLSGLTLSKLTSSMMVISGEQKTNIGLNLKFEAKGLKVLGYSRKSETGWEFSPKAIDLISEYRNAFPEVVAALDRKGNRDMTRPTDFFEESVAASRLKELKSWLAEKGVRDFDKVPLYSEELEKHTVMGLEAFADKLVAQKAPGTMKQAAIKNIPRHALLKPAHTLTRLRDQSFGLGDRVILVAETGSVPLSAKGTVVGIQTGFVDVVFDVQFMGGTTLGDRCSAHRGQTVAPTSVLNLSNRQFATGINQPPPVPAAASRGRGVSNPNAIFRRGPRGGPAILPASGLPAAGFHPAPQTSSRGRGLSNGGVRVLQNPSRQSHFDPAQYGAAARGQLATQRSAEPTATPESFTHLQSLGAALGIPVSVGASHHQSPRGGHTSQGAPPPHVRGHLGPRGVHRGAPQPPPHHQQQVHTPSNRGAMGGGFVGGYIDEKGQGVELLLFSPEHLRGSRITRDDLQYVLVETVPDTDDGKLKAASLASLSKNLFLKEGSDVHLVRTGKRIPWTGDTDIQAFLWRMSDSYESWLREQVEIREAQEQHRAPQPDPRLDQATYTRNLGCFAVIEKKLGVEHHTWDVFHIFDDDPSLMPEDFISTAYFSVILPPILDRALVEIEAAPRLQSLELTHKCLNVLFEIVANQYGRHAFKFWPAGVQTDNTTMTIPDSVLKFRLYAYLLDVALFHLRRSKPALDCPVSFSLLRTLKRVRAGVGEAKCTIDAFEKLLSIAITREMTQLKSDAALLSNLVVGRLLDRPIPRGKPVLEKRELLHIITLGCSPSVFNALHELIHYLLIKSHPYSTSEQRPGQLSRDQQIEWSNRPKSLRISIAESRPSGAGVEMARNLHAIVESSSERARQLRDLSRSYLDGSGLRGTSEGLLGTGGLGSPGGRQGQGGARGNGSFGGLYDLLREAESQLTPLESTKVSIEVFPDGAMAQMVREAKAGAIVLIGAERVMSSDGRFVAPLGSYTAAFMGTEAKSAVLVVAPTSVIEPSFRDKDPKLEEEKKGDVVKAWKAFPGVEMEGLDEFLEKVKAKDTKTIDVVGKTSEVVPAKFVGGFMTEKGVTSIAGVSLIGKERGEDEVDLCGK